MTVHGKLMNIQSQLKAPKNQFNSFGNYKYRSCEDILEALKPMLKENGLTLTITDGVVNIGNRYYVESLVKLTDVETSETITVTAQAREEETKKGMDSAQITGSTSSYARKYALNGMFCIDDTKDADSSNEHDKGQGNSAGQGRQNPPPTTPPNAPQVAGLCSDCGNKITDGVKTVSEKKFGKPLCMNCQKKHQAVG